MTSIEKLHWFDQNSDFPNLVFARLRFGIRLDPGLAEQALTCALSRQPLAFMRPVKNGRRWNWVQNQAGTRYFELQNRDVEPQGWGHNWIHGQPFAAFRLRLLDFPDAGRVVSEAQFCSHHAASDGLASIGLINDWLIIYNNLVAGREPDFGLSTVDSSKVKHRGRLGLTQWSYLRQLPCQAIALFGAAKFIFRSIAKLSVRDVASPKGSSPDFPAITSRWLAPNELESIQRRAKVWKVSLTSMCLSACFAAIDHWNQAPTAVSEPGKPSRPDKPRWPWRIIFPISIRGRHDGSLPASNRTAIVQIDRYGPEVSTDPTFCQGIDREINIIRSWQLEKMFLIAIRIASLSNGWLKKIANNPGSRGVAVFTHLGRPYKRARIYAKRLVQSSPELSHQIADPIDFDLVGPIRSGTPFNFSFSRQDKRMKITLHFDGALISPVQAQRLLAIVAEKIQFGESLAKR